MTPPEELDPDEFPLLLERATAKPEIAGRLILGFREQYEWIAADLRHELSLGNLEEPVHLARSLAKVAQMLGAERLAEAASRLEAAIPANESGAVSFAISQLETTLAPVLHAARKLEHSDETDGTAPVIRRHPQGGCVLVIDDEPSMRELLQDVLQDEFHTLTAADAAQALRVAEQERPDLILLDVDLPDVNGYTLLPLLQKNEATRSTPVIFVTGSSDIASETRGLNLGAVDYVVKPINPAILMARIRSQIKIKRAESEARRRIQREHYLELVAEYERSELLEETRQMQLKLKDDFLSHVSHELRAPSMSIHSFISLVADGLAGEVTNRQIEYLAIATRNVEHLQAMIEDLLEATRLGSGKLSIETSTIFITEAVEYAIHTVSPAAKRKSIKLSAHCPSGLPPCQADPTRLRQTLTILLDNAVKFTPASGSVTITARIFDQDPSALLIEVADTGCGISPDKVGSVFDRLYQCAEPGQQSRGLGLGLHIAQELVERQGGRIWVDSVVGSGSTFCFTLPVSTEKVPDAEELLQTSLARAQGD
jgi:signal transduction histidine kinase/HPt (histidine-containing phosphotransfer) domain-containing protein